ncbi:hypothetical protein ACWDR9_31890 [Streptosporangium sandarakinum]
MAIKSSSGRTIAALTIGVLAGSLLAAGGIAAASSDSDVIHACVRNRSGDVRIVAETTTCRTGERKLSWNENLSQGPADPVKPRVLAADFNFPGGGHKFLYCPDGKTATGGGFLFDELGETGREIIASVPSAGKEDTPNGWLVIARKARGKIYVVCV